MDISAKIKNIITDLPGWRTDRKFVIFESDDWGSNRMPSIENLRNLEKKGIKLSHSKYATLDSLEKKEDLELLIELLLSQKNANNRSPKFTTNMVMGNPDYEKIRTSSFSCFYHQNLWDSYLYYYGTDLKPLWEKAIAQNIFSPQYHARQHLNTRLWMRDLKMRRKNTLEAFNQNFFGVLDGTSSKYQQHYLMEYFTESLEDLVDLKSEIKMGLEMFSDFFSSNSKTFVACNYVWPIEIERFLKELGVNSIQGQRGQIVPLPKKKGVTKVRHHYTGEMNRSRQYYTVRNVLFEPFEDQNFDWVNSAIKDISRAFFLKKPAIVSTHRVNYVSNLSTKNRDSSLYKLENLLKEIIKRWPDVEFISSTQLSKLMHNK